jgi:GNAT superfamily N-acetyltransferase
MVSHKGEAMLPIEIRRVQSKKDRAVFVKMAWQFYRTDPRWVPPLISDQMEFIDPEKGVFFDHGEAELFLAYRGDKPVGRISAHINRRYDDIYGGEKGFIGFFECENSLDTASALFNSAERWLRGKGRTNAEGPMSFGVYDELGILIDGFDSPPYLLTGHNPPYYRELLEKCGWEKSIDWFAFRGMRGHTDTELDPKYFKLSEKVMKRDGITLRPMDVKDNIEREAEIVKSIFAAAWDENWGHVPLSDGEFDRLKQSLVRIVIPELSLVAELDGKPVAFTLSAYDANVAVKKTGGRLFPFGFITLLTGIKKTDRFRLILMGVLEEYRNQGIEIAMYTRVIEEGIRLGFREVEMSMIVENNERMLSSIERLPVERYKTWRIFRKDLRE